MHRRKVNVRLNVFVQSSLTQSLGSSLLVDHADRRVDFSILTAGRFIFEFLDTDAVLDNRALGVGFRLV